MKKILSSSEYETVSDSETQMTNSYQKQVFPFSMPFPLYNQATKNKIPANFQGQNPNQFYQSHNMFNRKNCNQLNEYKTDKNKCKSFGRKPKTKKQIKKVTPQMQPYKQNMNQTNLQLQMCMQQKMAGMNQKLVVEQMQHAQNYYQQMGKYYKNILGQIKSDDSNQDSDEVTMSLKNDYNTHYPALRKNLDCVSKQESETCSGSSTDSFKSLSSVKQLHLSKSIMQSSKDVNSTFDSNIGSLSESYCKPIAEGRLTKQTKYRERRASKADLNVSTQSSAFTPRRPDGKKPSENKFRRRTYKRKNTETKITANDSTSCDSIMLESDPSQTNILRPSSGYRPSSSKNNSVASNVKNCEKIDLTSTFSSKSQSEVDKLKISSKNSKVIIPHPPSEKRTSRQSINCRRSKRRSNSSLINISAKSSIASLSESIKSIDMKSARSNCSKLSIASDEPSAPLLKTAAEKPTNVFSKQY